MRGGSSNVDMSVESCEACGAACHFTGVAGGDSGGGLLGGAACASTSTSAEAASGAALEAVTPEQLVETASASLKEAMKAYGAKLFSEARQALGLWCKLYRGVLQPSHCGFQAQVSLVNCCRYEEDWKGGDAPQGGAALHEVRARQIPL